MGRHVGCDHPHTHCVVSSFEIALFIEDWFLLVNTLYVVFLEQYPSALSTRPYVCALPC